MAKKEYRFNPDTLAYEEVKEPFRLRFYRFTRKGIVVFIVVCVLNLLFSSIYYTPKMNRIARHEQELLVKYRILNDRINITEHKVRELRDRDHNVYRNMFGADSIDIPGTFTPYPETRYAYMAGDDYGWLMTDTWEGLDALARELYLQSRSLD